MSGTSTTLTLKAIEELLERKLEEKFDEKLQPIKDDIANIKHVVEHKVYKEMKEGFAEVNKRIDHLEELTMAIVEDHEEHSVRIKRLEKHTGISSDTN